MGILALSVLLFSTKRRKHRDGKCPGSLRVTSGRRPCAGKGHFCYTFRLNLVTLASREPPGALREAWAVLASPALSCAPPGRVHSGPEGGLKSQNPNAVGFRLLSHCFSRLRQVSARLPSSKASARAWEAGFSCLRQVSARLTSSKASTLAWEASLEFRDQRNAKPGRLWWWEFRGQRSAKP